MQRRNSAPLLMSLYTHAFTSSMCARSQQVWARADELTALRVEAAQLCDGVKDHVAAPFVQLGPHGGLRGGREDGGGAREGELRRIQIQLRLLGESVELSLNIRTISSDSLEMTRLVCVSNSTGTVKRTPGAQGPAAS
jgi:hypothetical protein